MNKLDHEDLNITMLEFREFVGGNLSDFLPRREETDFHELIYIKGGRVTYYVGGKIYALRTGNFLFIPRGEIRQFYYDNKKCLHLYTLKLDYSLDKGKSVAQSLYKTFSISKNIRIAELFDEIAEVWRNEGRGHYLMSKAISLRLLYEIVYRTKHEGVDDHKDNRVEIIKDYIYTHYKREINVKEIADMLNLNANYLGSYFKKETGYSIREYMNYIRINQAKDLLSTGKYSVSYVADYCGYRDVYYFSKIFKDMEGVPPSVFI